MATGTEQVGREYESLEMLLYLSLWLMLCTAKEVLLQEDLRSKQGMQKVLLALSHL